MSRFDSLAAETDLLLRWAELRHEQGLPVEPRVEALCNRVRALRDELERAVADETDAEPNGLDRIRAARPDGPRDLVDRLAPAVYADRLRGGWLARCAGCTLGAIVEQWPVEDMEQFAAWCGAEFPPTDYWPAAATPHALRYDLSRAEEYIRGRLTHVPVDDDLTYTLLGLLILEDSGPGFTTADVAEAWRKYLPVACTAEEVTLENLRAGLPWQEAGSRGNPYAEWIGADIRSDPWGYVCPGRPEKAAELAWRDARLSHRRNGIYGAMYFAAAIAAAFVVDDPLEAARIALAEIPRSCRLHRELTWALDRAGRLDDWREARRRVDQRFPGMARAHTINNACLTVFGLALGRGDVTRTLGLTVAMGLDNDCTAATAGSIVGAVRGAGAVPEHWWRPFRGKVRTYLTGHEWFDLDDIVARFARAARRVSVE